MQKRPDLDAIEALGCDMQAFAEVFEAILVGDDGEPDNSIRAIILLAQQCAEDIPALLAYVRELEEQKVREIAEHSEDAYAKGYKDGLKRPKP